MRQMPGGKNATDSTVYGVATPKRVMETFRPYRKRVWFTIGIVLVSVAIGLLPPWFLREVVDQGLIKDNLHITAEFSILTIVATILASLLTYWYGYLSVTVGQFIMRDLRFDLFRHLQAMSLRFFTNTRTGEIQSRLLSDVSGVQSVVSDVVTNAISNVGIVGASIIAMFILDWRLTLLAIGVIPIFAYLSSRAGTYARDVRRNTQEQTAELNSLMQETLSVSGVLLTKAVGRRHLVVEKFARENESLSGWQVKIQMIQYFFFGLIRMIFSLTPALAYWLAGILLHLKIDAISLGTLVAFTSLQARMFFPLSGLLSVQVEVKSAMALFDRIFEYLDKPLDIVDAADAVELEPSDVVGRVEFKDVVFHYDPEAKPTIDHVSLEARPGKLVALVGPSGAGKTTLTYLLARLYDVDSGSVTIDEVDVRHIKLTSLEKIIGAVTQETYLLHDTILENLRYANPDASVEEIEAATKAAAIHDHIASLPDGYNTIVGERGYKLSGGEKQRMAIARAILKNPRLLILDEATSALDTASERRIQKALDALMEGRTTFAIAHRLSTIVNADQILVVDGGRVVERGKHAELLKLNGAYSRLYDEQFSSERKAQPGLTEDVDSEIGARIGSTSSAVETASLGLPAFQADVLAFPPEPAT